MNEEFRFTKVYFGTLFTFIAVMLFLLSLPVETISQLPFFVKVAIFAFIVSAMAVEFAILIFNSVKNWRKREVS